MNKSWPYICNIFHLNYFEGKWCCKHTDKQLPREMKKGLPFELLLQDSAEFHHVQKGGRSYHAEQAA